MSFDGTVAVFPLTMDGRCEHAVLVAPNNWSDILDFIVAPGDYLDDVRDNAFPAGSQGIEWTLPEVVTASFQAIDISNDADRDLVLSTLPPGAYDDETLTKFRSNSNLDRLRRILSAGRFIIEFSIGTSNIYVRYIPPDIQIGDPRSHASRFTEVTVTGIEKSDISTFHFDVICDKDSRSVFAQKRANLVVDMLENVERFQTLLHESKFYRRTVRLNQAVGQIEAGQPRPQPASEFPIKRMEVNRVVSPMPVVVTDLYSSLETFEQAELTTADGGTTSPCAALTAMHLQSGEWVPIAGDVKTYLH